MATTQFASLPASTVRATCRALLDGLGVMLAASGSSAEVAPFVQHALAAATNDSATGGDGLASVFGTPQRAVSAQLAAFANGAMAHALDYEDAYDAAPVHPNASLLRRRGKKVATLRRQGIVPAVVYGHGHESEAIQISMPRSSTRCGATPGVTRSSISRLATPR